MSQPDETLDQTVDSAASDSAAVAVTAAAHAPEPEPAPTLPEVTAASMLPNGKGDAARSTPSTPALGIPKSLLEWQRYELLELVGAGGMGAVYKARDPRLGRMVALKIIHPGFGHGASASGELMVRRFHREARLQAALEHPHVCKVYEIGDLPAAGGDGDPAIRHPYIAMQLISGQPLQRAQSDMSLLEKVRIIQQVAEALHAAHRQGLIHRDIKPSSVAPD